MKTIYINKRQDFKTPDSEQSEYISYQKRQRRNKWMRKLHHNLNSRQDQFDHWNK